MLQNLRSVVHCSNPRSGHFCNRCTFAVAISVHSILLQSLYSALVQSCSLHFCNPWQEHFYNPCSVHCRNPCKKNCCNYFKVLTYPQSEQVETILGDNLGNTESKMVIRVHHAPPPSPPRRGPRIMHRAG